MKRAARSGLAIGVGGVLLLAGCELHPQDGGATVEETLASYFQSPSWDVAHLLQLAGLLVCIVGLLLARRDGVLDVRLRRQLLVTAIAWGLVCLELVPHVLARHDLHALQHSEATPMLDLHLVLGVVATPLFGVTAALLAVALAVTGRTWPAILLAVPGIVGGVAYALAGPLNYFTENVAFSPLFAGQALVAVFLVGTGIRLAVRSQDAARPLPALQDAAV